MKMYKLVYFDVKLNKKLNVCHPGPLTKKQAESFANDYGIVGKKLKLIVEPTR